MEGSTTNVRLLFNGDDRECPWPLAHFSDDCNELRGFDSIFPVLEEDDMDAVNGV
eukprot:CAMPEP_0178801338 /NCGR_PEP_ID=MMETSP0745-20121128/13296_1 /TAXON_ID=913974 /ORGANISM="Nitzschia punctata, Strain CCMP561" /LENGTH=54 /DNA_ID=CAMNT_0020460171 /DNA_START=79 /DNA_END=243 /DNA_ORIENTATION=+